MSAEDDLLALEDRVLAAAAGDWIGSIDRIRNLVALKDPGVREAVFRLVAPSIDQAALSGVAEAFGLGLDDALRIVRLGAPAARVPGYLADLRSRTGLSLPETSVSAISGLTSSAEEALAKTLSLMVAGIDLETALAPLFASRNHVKSSIEWALNDASNAGSEDVAVAAGLRLVWIAERDACVHCLAYSGQIRQTDGAFPPGLTFGAKPLAVLGDLRRPPLHPHCRCRLEPLNATQYALALQREARRSILRGWSLESESMSARVAAAQRLLDSGFDDAPASVIGFAQRAIKRGAFPSRSAA